MRLHYLAASLNGLSTWMLIFFFLGLFLRYFDFDSPWIVYISQSSYWVYLLHGPAFLMVGWLLLPLHLNVFLKFGLEVVGTSVICFVTYHYLVRTSWIGLLLHGRRFDMDWPWMKRRNPVQL
jgi:glucan biosynthesis protein C